MASRCHRETPLGMVEKLRQGPAYCNNFYDWQGRSTIPKKPETAKYRGDALTRFTKIWIAPLERRRNLSLGCTHPPVLIILYTFRSWLAWLAALTQKFLSSLNSILTNGNVELLKLISICMPSACCTCLSQSRRCCKIPRAGKTNRKHTLAAFFFFTFSVTQR